MVTLELVTEFGGHGREFGHKLVCEADSDSGKQDFGHGHSRRHTDSDTDSEKLASVTTGLETDSDKDFVKTSDSDMEKLIT